MSDGACKESPIFKALGEQNSQMKQLFELVENLKSRLGTIIISQEEEAKKTTGETPSPPRSDMERLVRENTAIAHDALIILKDTIEELQI